MATTSNQQGGQPSPGWPVVPRAEERRLSLASSQASTEYCTATDATSVRAPLSSDGDSTRPSSSSTGGDKKSTETTKEKPFDPRTAVDKEAEDNYKPKTVKFWLIILSAFISQFVVALDRTIISTAIPRITDEFKSLGDIGWYGSAYMLTTAAFQLLFGRVYRFYDVRWTLLICILIFEVGSLICGAAQGSAVFIVGRAIAGLGSAGITTGSMMVIIPMVPLHKRAVYQSMIGVVFGISSVAGPLIGGAFTEKATWRWCFYMNLPIGAVVGLFLFLFLESPKRSSQPESIKTHIMRLDPLGTFFFLPSMVSLILALQWGGSTFAWNNWRIIFLFIVFVVTAIAFGAVQVLAPKNATLPIRVIKQRTMLASAFFMLFLSGALMLGVYYIPLWFQTTHNTDPVQSGIYTIPLVLSLTISAVSSGFVTQKIGYYVPSMIVGPCITAIGEGLMTTFSPTTPPSEWIPYQFLTGFGTGMGMHTSSLAVQTTLAKEDIPTGVSIIFFAQHLGGAIFVSVGQTILSSLLVQKLEKVPGLDPEMIVTTGATQLRNAVPHRFLSTVINAYNFASTRIFYCALALSLAQLVCACCVEWRSIKKVGPKGPA